MLHDSDGRAVQALYMRLVDQESIHAPASALVAWEKNINTLHARPVKVFSPYQMLKAAFQLRGFEGMLTDYAQAAFIFDEIHAYEPARLALILAMVVYLRKNFGARLLRVVKILGGDRLVVGNVAANEDDQVATDPIRI